MENTCLNRARDGQEIFVPKRAKDGHALNHVLRETKTEYKGENCEAEKEKKNIKTMCLRRLKLWLSDRV